MVNSSTQKHASQRDQGTIEIFPSGSLRVSVYAGLNPLSKRRHYLKETIKPAFNPSKKQLRDAWKRAESTRDDFLALVRQKKQPLTNATIADLIDRYYDSEQTSLRIGELHLLMIAGIANAVRRAESH